MLTVNELFSGIGAFRKALINLNIPYEIVGISEIDKFSIQSYEAMYGKTRNYGDISKIERLDYADLWTYGFPCQDISQAGKQAGIVKGKTRSGLLYEVERLLATSVENGESPKYLIMENVKALVGKKFINDFYGWVWRLNELGYYTWYKVINAADYGIPQKRERVIAVSIRKDLHQQFKFPSPIPLKFSFQDALEEHPDEKYFLSDEMYRFCTERDQYCKSHNLGYRFTPLERESCKIAKTITTREGSRIENNFIREAVHTDSDSLWKTEVEEREHSKSVQPERTMPDNRNKRRRTARSEDFR